MALAPRAQRANPGLDANPHWPAPGGVPSGHGAGAYGEDKVDG